MQVQNIQRPKLFIPFFLEQLIWNSDYLSYINTNSHSKATSFLNITKKSIKDRHEHIKRALRALYKSRNHIMACQV